MSAAAVPPTPRRRRWPAPAKLNLFLHVTGRRSDGFHDLQTLFQLLDWGDELEIAVTAGGRIERLAGPEGLAPDRGPCCARGVALQSACGVRQGAQISASQAHSHGRRAGRRQFGCRHRASGPEQALGHAV